MKVARYLLPLVLSAMVAVSTAQPAMAQTVPAVPNRPWYPPGYRDLRIAAAEQVRTFPRDRQYLLTDDFESPHKAAYDLIDCTLGDDLPRGMSVTETELSLLALDMARMRAEFRRLGYLPAIYDQPLLEYERKELARIKAGPVAEPEADDPADDQAGDAADEQADDAADADDSDPETLGERDYIDVAFGDFDPLVKKLQAKRLRLQPKMPGFIVEGGCGGAESPFTIKLLPATGQLWLINAFAFRLCERKVANPWNHGACSWTQYDAGDTAYASGRYMYEARWPGGVVQRGAKILQGDPAEDQATVITFRQN